MITNRTELDNLLREYNTLVQQSSLSNHDILRLKSLSEQMVSFKESLLNRDDYIKLVNEFPLIRIESAEEVRKARSRLKLVEKQTTYWGNEYVNALRDLIEMYTVRNEDDYDY